MNSKMKHGNARANAKKRYDRYRNEGRKIKNKARKMAKHLKKTKQI